MIKITIVDGYVDEPTCLGVPPYISPYPRYISGAIATYSSDISIQYLTIDQIRQNKDLIHLLNKSTIIIVISGMIVPGKYLAGYPIHPKELITIFQQINKPMKLLCGPAAIYGFGTSGGRKPEQLPEINTLFDGVIKGDPEIVIHSLLQQNLNLQSIDMTQKRKNTEQIEQFAKNGASIVTQHPNFPDRLIVEIETYRGCPRNPYGGCSFCAEPFKGFPDFRSIPAIHAEINALYDNGIRHFRLGNQPCLFSFQSKDIGKNEYPTPNPAALKNLFQGIRSIAPDLKTLHIDNVNPLVIARHPEEARQIIDTIIMYHTSGDVAAFGVESLDQTVIDENNLKTDETEILKAIRLFNEHGSTIGSNGLPELLPGLNFVFGLKGESKHTFKKNLNFLQSLIQQNLLVRRINIRKVIPLPGTPMESVAETLINRHKKQFQSFKYKVKTIIEKPLLERMIPAGRILTNVIPEIWKGHITFGRQMGSYPILVGIPGNYPLYTPLDVSIIDHGYRSVTGIPYPLHINTCPRKTIESINGIGKKRATKILLNRPFSSIDELDHIIDDPAIRKYLQDIISLEKTEKVNI